MGLVSNRVGRTEIVAGDHIYSWRSAFAYSHHGIYVGGDKVVHFTRQKDVGTSGHSFLASADSTLDFTSNFSGSNSKIPEAFCPNFPDCGFRKPESGVVISCLDCFLAKGALYRFEYGVSPSLYIAKFRGGTCTTAKADMSEEVVHRAMHLLRNGLGNYDVFKNNCEDFALYCKTGLLTYDQTSLGRSSQAACAMGVPLAALFSSPLRVFMSSPACAAIATAGVYCASRYAADVGVRTDVVKVKVEDMALFSGCGGPMKDLIDFEDGEGCDETDGPSCKRQKCT